MEKISADWPLIVRANNMICAPDGTLTNSPAAVEIQLSDVKGQTHTLRLSSAAAIMISSFLINYPEAKRAFAEQRVNRPFRIDKFAPAIEIMIELGSDVDFAKLAGALSALTIDHSNFCFAIDRATGNAILGAIDEMQLAELLDAVKRVHGVQIKTIGRPQVAYRERITRRTEIDYIHKKQSGGAGEFARVKLVLEPTPDDYEHAFMAIRARSILREDFIDAAECGVRNSLTSGVLAGFPVIGMRVLLIDGASHDTNSTALAFEMAAQEAIREGLRQAVPEILEPIMRVEIVTPEIFLDAIIDDLKARQGTTDGRGRRSRSGIVVDALVSAVNLFGYAASLRATTEGRATFTTQFDRYAPLPRDGDAPFRPAVDSALSASTSACLIRLPL